MIDKVHIVCQLPDSDNTTNEEDTTRHRNFVIEPCQDCPYHPINRLSEKYDLRAIACFNLITDRFTSLISAMRHAQAVN